VAVEHPREGDVRVVAQGPTRKGGVLRKGVDYHAKTNKVLAHSRAKDT